jgi:D-arabinose 1-dehydrogenase-like Zn-dependent alcohol dehydrogenase
MPSELAAPLQCAGSTVYSAIINSSKPGDRVGILGIGGLGHLAIQFSAKMGFETVVFSTTKAKEAEAKAFGASEFYLLEELDKIERPVCEFFLFVNVRVERGIEISAEGGQHSLLRPGEFKSSLGGMRRILQRHGCVFGNKFLFGSDIDGKC